MKLHNQLSNVLKIFILILSFSSQALLASNSIEFNFPKAQFSLNQAKIESFSVLKSEKAKDLYSVKMKLKEKPASELASLTAANLGKQFKIVLEGKTIQSPTIMAKTGRELMIEGLTKEQATKIMKTLSNVK